MRRDVLAKGEWDETWARRAREEKQTADSSHVFDDIHTCQNNLINQLKSTTNTNRLPKIQFFCRANCHFSMSSTRETPKKLAAVLEPKTPIVLWGLLSTL